MRLAYLGVRVERSMHPEWLSNAYLVWDEASRESFFVASRAALRRSRKLFTLFSKKQTAARVTPWTA